jgi:hypothetical protein
MRLRGEPSRLRRLSHSWQLDSHRDYSENGDSGDGVRRVVFFFWIFVDEVD